jgi:hypothetical protein
MTDMESMAQRISSALNDHDMTAFGSLIAEDAKWGHQPETVRVRAGVESGVAAMTAPPYFARLTRPQNAGP